MFVPELEDTLEQPSQLMRAGLPWAPGRLASSGLRGVGGLDRPLRRHHRSQLGDIGGWEYRPLGPFRSKNFASTPSPWVVTLDALASFRGRYVHPEGDTAPLHYLDSPGNRERGAINIELEVWVQTAAMREAGHAGDRLMLSNYCDAYWTIAQMVAVTRSTGCKLL